MEHIIVTQMKNGYKKLVPEEGYLLFNRYTRQYYSEATVKNINGFEAVPNGVPPTPTPDPTPEELLQRAKNAKMAAITAYDSSSAVNGIIVRGAEVWVPAAERAILKTSIEAYKAMGAIYVTKVWEGVQYILPVDTWLYMINAVEVYASECYNVTARHKASVNALDTIEAVEAYDYTTGYPQKLVFDI